MMPIALHGDKEWEKFNKARLEHWSKVAHWRPRCHCTQYCTENIVKIDYAGDPVIIRGMRDNNYKPIPKKLPAQGLTRPYHCKQQAGRHPGYKTKVPLIISFILKLALHRGWVTRSVIKRRKHG